MLRQINELSVNISELTIEMIAFACTLNKIHQPHKLTRTKLASLL